MANDNKSQEWPYKLFSDYSPFRFSTDWGRFFSPPPYLPMESVVVIPTYSNETDWSKALGSNAPLEGCDCDICNEIRMVQATLKRMTDKAWEELNQMSFSFKNYGEKVYYNPTPGDDVVWSKLFRELGLKVEKEMEKSIIMGDPKLSDVNWEVIKADGYRDTAPEAIRRGLENSNLSDCAQDVVDEWFASPLSWENFIREKADKQKADLEEAQRKWKIYKEESAIRQDNERFRAWLINTMAVDDDDDDEDWDDEDDFDDDDDDDEDWDDEDDDDDEDYSSFFTAEAAPVNVEAVASTTYSRPELSVKDVLGELQQILEVRGTNYNHPADNFQIIADGWTWYARAKGLLSPDKSYDTDDVGDFMKILKMSRGIFGPMDDHDLDSAGYAIGKIRARDEIQRRTEDQCPLEEVPQYVPAPVDGCDCYQCRAMREISKGE